jgi:hypothetical protein
MAELLEKIPAEKCWAITAKILSAFFVMRGEKIIAPLLGKEEGFISPVRGAEMWHDIAVKIFGDGGRQLCSMFKEMFNIPVEDCIEANKLLDVAAMLQQGPENEGYYVEKTPDRVVWRKTKCTWMERYKEYEVDPTLRPCISGCPAWCEEGLKVVNPKLTIKSTKQLPRGDSYCEFITEFKDE